MEASQMMDVLHYYFEEDNHFVSEESAQSRSNIREHLYRELYKIEYKYKYEAKKEPKKFDFDEEESNYGSFSEEQAESLGGVKPFNPRAQETKPYIPPTPVDPDSSSPFGPVLDAPLN